MSILERLWKLLRLRLGLDKFWSGQGKSGDGQPPDDGSADAQTNSPPEAPAPTPSRRTATWIPSGPNGWPSVRCTWLPLVATVTDYHREFAIVRKNGSLVVSNAPAASTYEKPGSKVVITQAQWHRPLSEIPRAPLVDMAGVRFQFSRRENEESVEEVP